ncbi:DUF4913 domain-containing protein [Nocardia sp. NPDC049190]|uniref:DUF4913 domain-containing protein n=1 Tax=Nocardia sp. NPDC049190 TaxID=3155650 RepID=UPI0034090852
MDLTEALDSAVRAAVAGQITAAATAFTKGALEQVLTDEVVVGMQQLALREASAAVDPEQEPVEKPRKLRYRSLEEFVTGHIAHLYPRDIPAHKSETTPRWCPCWWAHGEAVSRLGALWRAFEHMRHGDNVEMVVWWVQYADPLMERLMDPEGTFKYCSVADGHSTKLTKLATLVIVADRDTAGYRRAERVMGSLVGLVGRVRVVQAATGKDLHDHLQCGHEIRELEPVPHLDPFTPGWSAAPAPATPAPAAETQTVSVASSVAPATTPGGNLMLPPRTPTRWTTWAVSGRCSCGC